MAVDDLRFLRKDLAEAFEDRLPPVDLDVWEIIPVDEAENPSEDPVFFFDVISRPDDFINLVDGPDYYGTGLSGHARNVPAHPGGPIGVWKGSPVPPPDALAFYLPFHFFHPTWWGIYLIKEGVTWLADFITNTSKGAVSPTSSFGVARMFLYGHEQFHHVAECFTTRLELTHRTPLYRLGVWRQYERTFGTPACTEEALANAYGFDKARQFAKRVLPANEQFAALQALQDFMLMSPPGYSAGVHYLTPAKFTQGRLDFAEEYHRAALPNARTCGSDIWRASPHAFQGIARIGSRVNYLVRRGSPLSQRGTLGRSAPIRYREVAMALAELGCRQVDGGRGSHEKWANPTGASFPVPRHPGDLKRGTLKAIFKQAGRPMSFTEIQEFVRERG